MEESEKEGKFEYSDIFAYVSTMASTQASSQRTRNVLYESEPSFFGSERHRTALYYVGGGKQLNFSLLCIDLLRSVYYVSKARLYLWYVNY